MNSAKNKTEKRNRRHRKVRSKVVGTADRPRLSVFKSNQYMYAQLIDDEKGITIVGVHSKESKAKTPKDKAKDVGKRIAKKAQEKNIKNVVFDRGGYIFTGKIKVLADSAREEGLIF